MRACRSGLRARGIWLVALVAAATVGVLVAGSPRAVHASDPPGDCWDGALSAEPIQCYVLEEAQRAGMIEVNAIFHTPDNILYVFLSSHSTTHQSAYGQFYSPLAHDKSVVKFIKSKTAEFVERWPERVFFDHEYTLGCVFGRVGRGIPYAQADATVKAEYRECLLRPYETDIVYVPFPKTYEDIQVLGGGAEAVRSMGGWASFRQLWPTVTPRDAPSGQFDVSDVDTVNFPEEMDCSARIHLPAGGCGVAQFFPDLGIAGWISRGDALYVQIKAAPDDVERIRTVRETLVAKGANGERLTIIPVKYSYEELWRWATILKRFSLSASNTLGITGAGLRHNSRQHNDDVFLSGLQEREGENFLTYRTTIAVWSKKPRETADALPRLLGQFNIPVDAVGLVTASYRGGAKIGFRLDMDRPTVEDAAAAVVSAVDDSPWTLIAVAGSTAAAVAACLAAMAFAVRRVRRQRA